MHEVWLRRPPLDAAPTLPDVPGRRRLALRGAAGPDHGVEPLTHPAQLVQIVGALLNMGAFALLHFEIAPSSALRYLIPNWLGSVLLVASAYVDRQWGFLMLESAWLVVTGYAIAARIGWRSRPRRG
jgi:hypothetical protein